jgi:hypothetical protein
LRCWPPFGCRLGLAWRNLTKSSDLQLRLVRASELNSHLKEMNLAAAGLAHETRNPLNIIRGLAQMISKQPTPRPKSAKKSRAIVDETDKVTAQLNEFINYSRPREVRAPPTSRRRRRSGARLEYDIEEKKSRSKSRANRLSSRRTNNCCARRCSICCSTPSRPSRRRRRHPDRRQPAQTHSKAFSKSATTARACPGDIAARKFSSRISPPTRKGTGLGLRSSSKSSWPTAGKSNACPTSRKVLSSAWPTSNSRERIELPPESGRITPRRAS